MEAVILQKADLLLTEVRALTVRNRASGCVHPGAKEISPTGT